MLTIRTTDLQTVLTRRREYIGVRPIWDSILIFVTGLFYLPAALAMTNEICRWAFFAFGMLVTVYGIVGIVRVVHRRYTVENLYEEIAGMNIISSSIVAITQPGIPDSNRYLLYYDKGWDCWFFPNRRSTPDVQDDERDLQYYLNVEFKIPLTDCSLDLHGTKESVKFSTEHNEERHYLYRIYSCHLQVIPQMWSAEDGFEVGGHQCKWMTIAEMLQDKCIHEVNDDVVTAVRDLIAG